MGCDIHLHTEIKVRGHWHHYSQPMVKRHYMLFEKMAGVRGHVENAIAPPRGLPEDATFTTFYDHTHDGGDAHSTSWLSASEVAGLIDWYESEMKKLTGESWYSAELKDFGFLFGNGWDGFKQYPSSYPAGLEDIRWIFWFDN